MNGECRFPAVCGATGLLRCEREHCTCGNTTALPCEGCEDCEDKRALFVGSGAEETSP